jgi:Ca-activated chloride channel family protein
VNDLLDKLDPGFFEPVWLLVGVLAVVAVTLLEIGAYRRRNQALKLFVAPHLVSALTSSVSSTKRIWKRLLLIAGVACLFIALARPHLFFRWQEETRAGVDMLFAVDCSKSMLTEDVKPSRLERAKLAISDFADQVPEDRLGLIDFAGDAFLQVPLTLDHDAFQSAVQELDTDSIPKPGTDIATAIDLAVSALKSQIANTKILLLVTDGEDLEGRVIAAATEAAKSGLKIYTIGVGTPDGDLIPERDDSGDLMYLHDGDGQIVKSKLDEPTLKQIASITGGAYARLGQRGEGLQEIYQKYIATLPRHQVESRRQRIEFEQYEWPLSLSILLLLASLLMSERNRPTAEESAPVAPPRKHGLRPSQRPAPAAAAAGVTALALLLVAGAPLHAATSDTAERDYKSGNYPDAEQNYHSAATQQPNRDDLKYNAGDAAYKAGEYSQAEQAYRDALETPDLGMQESTYYNLGNAQYRQGEGSEKDDQKKTIRLWQDALKSYESSLKLRQSADAQHNYEFVKEKLEQLKQQQQQQQQNQQNQNQQNKNQQNQKDKGKQGSGQSQNNNQGQSQNPQNQDGSQNQKNGGNQDQSGQNSPQNNQGQKGQNPDNSQGQQGQHTPEQMNGKDPMQGHSVSRDQDQTDPGTKSEKDAEALLDSLKDDEKHITAQSLNNGNEPPPPPPSGKDW